MKILYLTHSQIGDRSFGGAMRANAIRDALVSMASVDTLIIHGGPAFSADPTWSPDRVRGATVSRYGLSITALRQRQMLARWVARVIENERYDFIVAQYLDLALLVPAAARSRMIFDPDDFRKTLTPGAPAIARGKLEVRNMLARRLARQARHVWYANPAANQLPPTSRRSFLPNIIIPPNPERQPTSVCANRLLMVGFFAHKPNVEGLTWFYDKVLPGIRAARPDVEFHVVGRCDRSTSDRMPNAVFHGYVTDLTGEYDRAAIVVAPIQSGGGTQIKVIDALAHGKPTVVSAFAHAGFADQLVDGEHLVVADSAADWIERCIWALDHPEQIAKMARQGEAVVRAKFSPEHLRQLIKMSVDKLRTER